MILRFNFYPKKSPMVPFLVILICLVVFGSLLFSNKGFISTEKHLRRSNYARKADSENVLKSKTLEDKTKLVLYGIIQVGAENYVYLKTPNNEEYILKEGASAGDFEVDVITMDSVIITRSGNIRETIKW